MFRVYLGQALGLGVSRLGCGRLNLHEPKYPTFSGLVFSGFFMQLLTKISGLEVGFSLGVEGLGFMLGAWG